MWYKFSQIKTDQPSLFFEPWHEGNLITDEQGKPKTLFHGTFSEPFNEFKTKVNPYAIMGPNVFYTSDDPSDVERNYTNSDSGDIQQKIDRTKDKLLDWFENDEDGFRDYYNLGDMDEVDANEELDKIAERELGFKNPHTYPLYGKMKNPAILAPKQPKSYNHSWTEDESGEPIEYIGNAEQIFQEIESMIYDNGYPDYKIKESIQELKNLLGEGFNDYDLYDALVDGPLHVYDYIEDGNPGSFAKELFARLGKDGIIMDAYHYFPQIVNNPGTKHYIFFDPKQVKSPFNKTFDPNSKRIDAQSGSWYKFSRQSPEIFAQQLSEKYGAQVILYLTKNNDLKIDHLVVSKEKRNQGIGSAIMREIIDYADSNGYRAILTTGTKDPNFGTTSSGRLKKFYKKFDFTENKGKDFSISENMLRNPK